MDIFEQLEKVCVLTTLAFILTQTKLMANLHKPKLPVRDRITALVVFLAMGLLEEFVAHQSGLINARIVAVCAAGLIAGPAVGVVVGIAITALACTIDHFPLPAVGTSMIVAGLIGGLLRSRLPAMALRPSIGFALGAGTSILRYILLITLPMAHGYAPTGPVPLEIAKAIVQGAGVALILVVLGKAREQDSCVRAASMAEVRALQARMDPHFLYNALNTLSALSVADPEAVPVAASRLAHFMRASLDQHDRPLIPLREELDVVNAYLDVESLRLGHRLAVERDVDASLLSMLVPPFLLQPLVENAIRHGLQPKPNGGVVRVAAYARKEHLELRVSDDGIGMPQDIRIDLINSETGRAHAIGLLRRRLRHLYGDHFIFSLTSEPGHGACATMRIPLISIDHIPDNALSSTAGREVRAALPARSYA